MNTQRILSAGIAVVVVVAVGLSASTLAASMSTDPADAVDVEYDALPLGDDAQGAVAVAAQGIHDQYSGASGGGDTAAESASPSGKAGQGAREPSGGDTASGVPQRDGGQAQSGASGASGGLALSAWPRWLLVLAALLIALVAVAYRYRDRLRRAVERDEGASERLAPAPENEVERAWVELVRRAGVQRPRTRTPRHCAEQAVENGYDPTVVRQLRRAFEDVRYGSAAPTDEQARVATEALSRLDGERA